jgi:hypothetical protein
MKRRRLTGVQKAFAIGYRKGSEDAIDRAIEEQRRIVQWARTRLANPLQQNGLSEWARQGSNLRP